MLDFVFCILYFVFCILDFVFGRCWIHMVFLAHHRVPLGPIRAPTPNTLDRKHAQHQTHPNSQSRGHIELNIHHLFWILYFVFWILDFGFCILYFVFYPCWIHTVFLAHHRVPPWSHTAPHTQHVRPKTRTAPGPPQQPK